MPIDFTLHQAHQLADMWGGDEEPDTLITVAHCEQGHSGPGLYAWFEEYPEEGSVKLDEQPQPADESGVPGDGDYYSEEAADIAESKARAVLGVPDDEVHPFWCHERSHDRPRCVKQCAECADAAGVGLPDGSQR